ALLSVFSLQCYCDPRALPSFPTRRSSDLSMAQSRSSSLITSGGASRIVEPWVSLASTPRAASFSHASRPLRRADSTPAPKPRPPSEEHTSELQSLTKIAFPLLPAQNTPSD